MLGVDKARPSASADAADAADAAAFPLSTVTDSSFDVCLGRDHHPDFELGSFKLSFCGVLVVPTVLGRLFGDPSRLGG